MIFHCTSLTSSGALLHHSHPQVRSRLLHVTRVFFQDVLLGAHDVRLGVELPVDLTHVEVKRLQYHTATIVPISVFTTFDLGDIH